MNDVNSACPLRVVVGPSPPDGIEYLLVCVYLTATGNISGMVVVTVTRTIGECYCSDCPVSVGGLLLRFWARVGRLQSDVEQSETREHDLRCRKTDDLAIVR